jgi:hypothetical protein
MVGKARADSAAKPALRSTSALLPAPIPRGYRRERATLIAATGAWHLLNRWDPIGVHDEDLDFAHDEYDCLLDPLLMRLTRGDSRADLSEYLWHEVEEHSGSTPSDAG